MLRWTCWECEAFFYMYCLHTRLALIEQFLRAEGCSGHNFLASRVDWNINYIFGILTLKAIDWYINESILRGSGGGPGGSGNFGGCSRTLLGHLYKLLYIFGFLSSSAFDWHPCWVNLIRGGGVSGCLVTEVHGMPLSRSWGYVQANYQQLIPNLQFTYRIIDKLYERSKIVLWQRFWLGSCTKQVVSARACAYQFLPYNSSGIN